MSYFSQVTVEFWLRLLPVETGFHLSVSSLIHTKNTRFESEITIWKFFGDCHFQGIDEWLLCITLGPRGETGRRLLFPTNPSIHRQESTVRNFYLPLLLCALFVSTSYAQTIHDEAVDGDLSGVGTAPTSLTLSLGLNEIFGTIGNNGNTGSTNGQDADFFTFNLGSGLTINSIIASNSGGPSFIGHFAGSTISSPINQGGVTEGALFSGTNLELIGLGNTALPGIPVLNAGDHTIVLQETGDQINEFSITIDVSAVPEPGSLVILLGSAGVMLLRRRR